MPAVRGVDLDARTPARRSGWRASRAAASPRWPAALLRLLPPRHRVTGEVLLDGEDVLKMKPGRLRAVRWTDLAIVFQGALHSLNPVQRVGDQIAEAIRLHSQDGRGKVSTRVGELLELVGLPARRARDYPHQLSGGQRQRVLIGLALACEPRLLDRRRADDGARRDGPGAGAAAARGPAAATSAWRSSSSPTTSRRSPTVCRRIAVMYAGPDRRAGAQPRRSSPTPAHPYTRALGGRLPRDRRPEPSA